MDEDGISHRVREFITHHIDSVMQLELLLYLAANCRGEICTPQSLAQQLRVAATWVESQLRAMAAGGLTVLVAEGTSPQFRYEPRTAELSATVDELARAYADRRVTVIGLIFSKPVDKIRSFADAFRLRKDRPD